MKNRKRCLAVTIAVVSFLPAAAQDARLQQYIPPSPTAQEFMKYGEYPVSMYTGVPNISIPLYTIETKDLNLPISLNYHSSGIQVDQVSTQVGLSWSIQAGGIISRVPRGTVDDGPGGYLTYTVPEKDNLTFSYFFEEAATGLRDTESDIYYYNFGSGYSGSFFFDRNKQVRLIESAPIKIEYDNSSGIAFTITTQDGIVYEFKQKETTQSITFSYDPYSASMDIVSSTTFVSSWHLSKIILKNKTDVISFSYGPGGMFTANSFETNQYNYSKVIGDKPVPGECTGPNIIPNAHDLPHLSSSVMTVSNPRNLMEITFPNGKVEFNSAESTQGIVPDRLAEVVVKRRANGTYQRVKRYELGNDAYFYSSINASGPPVTQAHRYRSKLAYLKEYGTTDQNPKIYSFSYDESVPLPPLETNGKDYWGYYNGKNNNDGLIPGVANREPDPAFMQAGILKKITYPTGGYTEFYYEPHTYVTSEPQLITKTSSVEARGPQLDSDETQFTTNYSGTATLSITASDKNNQTAMNVFPNVLFEVTHSNGVTETLLNHTIHPTAYSFPFTEPLSKTFSFDLIPGLTYTLKVEAEGTSSLAQGNGNAFMFASISYREAVESPTQVTKIAGGLRIQQIKSFHEENQLSFSKTYEYEQNTLITPEHFLKENYLEEGVSFGQNPSGAPGCPASCITRSTVRKFYYGGTVRSLSLTGGSPVVYGKVNEFITDNSGNRLGKTTYTYRAQEDGVMPVSHVYMGGRMIIKRDWQGGQNTGKATYKLGQIDYQKIADESRKYVTRESDDYTMYKIVHNKRFSGCYGVIQGIFEIIEYPIERGVMLEEEITKTMIDDAGNETTTKTKIFYDNDTHLQPTRTITSTSEGNSIISKTHYPDDITSASYLSGGDLSSQETQAVDKLKTNGSLHRVAEPVQVETYKDKNNDGVAEASELLTIQRTNYKDWDTDLGLPADTDLVLPSDVEYLSGVYDANTNPMEQRVVYHQYDEKGNPVEISKTDDMHTVYIWGYNQTYPIASVTNANSNEVAYTGFEEDGTGNWSVGTNYNLAEKLTGSQSYTVSSSSTISKTGLDNSKNYIVSFWSRSGVATINGVTPVAGKTINGWTYYEQVITSATSVTIEGNAIIDELRLYPAGALMTTYTYVTGVGIVSTCDPNNNISFYEYDELGRLKLVRDLNSDIVKVYDYNYQIR